MQVLWLFCNRVKIFTRFLKLDSDSSGKLSLQELLSLPELRSNPLVKRVTGHRVYNELSGQPIWSIEYFGSQYLADVFDKDGSGDVDYFQYWILDIDRWRSWLIISRRCPRQGWQWRCWLYGVPPGAEHLWQQCGQHREIEVRCLIEDSYRNSVLHVLDSL